MSSPNAWANLARTLGLTPYEPTAGYGPGVGFRQVLRSLGAVGTEPSLRHWLYGRRHGVEVVVLNYETGGGSSTVAWTGALARVDPPLFLGLNLSRQGFLSNLFGASDIRLGDPAMDEELYVLGFDPARVASFLRPDLPHVRDLLTRMVGTLRQQELCVTDSAVLVSQTGSHAEPEPLGRMLDAGIWFARTLAARRAEVPRDDDLFRMLEWQAYASAAGLVFDPERLTLTGVRSGAAVEVALETEGQKTHTGVTVHFPSSTGLGLTVRRTGLPGFLQGLFGQDIKVGDKDFDEMFLVTGYPEPAVRALLGRPNVLGVLKAVGARTSEVQLNHAGMSFRLPGCYARADEVGALVDWAELATRDLFGATDALGPYR